VHDVGILLILLYSNHFTVLMLTVKNMFHKECCRRKVIFRLAQTSSAY